MNANDPAVAVVVPVRNEAGNIAALVAEIAKALDGQWRFEVIYVNDGSSDGSEAELKRLMAQYSWLRRVRHKQSSGQSAAVRSGVTAARAPLIVTLDGDGQNDPAFIPAMLRALEAGAPRIGLIAGQRVGRKASLFKQLQSRTALAMRDCSCLNRLALRPTRCPAISPIRGAPASSARSMAGMKAGSFCPSPSSVTISGARAAVTPERTAADWPLDCLCRTRRSQEYCAISRLSSASLPSLEPSLT